ncbi:CHAP domain-containing protein [Nocardioides ultimimeridianus]
MRRGALTVRWWSAVTAGALFTTLLVLTGGRGMLLHARETSGLSYFCSGYSGCRSAGYSDSGYGAVSNRMYWRMYPGHNCVNYAAYRMIQAGMPNTRPWTGGGNAANWGHAMASITNSTPAVGAVAWWDAYHHVGSAGHVAYVEKVISPTDIIISEDSWSGTFHWQEVTADGGFWPSGFIHFRDKDAGPVLANKVAPFITGTAQVGQTLTGHVGTWAGDPSAFAYQWTVGGAAIPGATAATYTPTGTQIGKPIGLSVTGSHAKSTSVTATAAATSNVLRGAFTNATLPTVTGDPIIDQTLTADPGDWTPAPTSYTYQWIADGKWIPGATSATLPLTADMLGQQIKVITHARGAGFRTATRTSPTPVTVLGRIVVTRPFAISGPAEMGGTLSVRGAFTPTTAAPSYQWLRDGAPVTGATASTYRLKAADLGHTMSVQVALAGTNYVPVSQTASDDRLVRSAGHLVLHSVGRNGEAVVRIHVRAPGMAPVTGRVQVRVARMRQTVTLVNGSARLVFDGLKPGRYGVFAYFLRSDEVHETHTFGGVRVL